jgi:hypothetical protein
VIAPHFSITQIPKSINKLSCEKKVVIITESHLITEKEEIIMTTINIVKHIGQSSARTTSVIVALCGLILASSAAEA